MKDALKMLGMLDAIALIRTIWWLTHMATCIFIILNAIANHGWGLLG